MDEKKTTGEQEAIAERAVRKVLSEKHQTPTPRSGDSAETRAHVAEHYQHCWNEGAGRRVWDEIESMRQDMNDNKVEQTKIMAVLGFWKWALPVAVAAAAFIGSMIRARHGG